MLFLQVICCFSNILFLSYISPSTDVCNMILRFGMDSTNGLEMLKYLSRFNIYPMDKNNSYYLSCCFDVEMLKWFGESDIFTRKQIQRQKLRIPQFND